MMRSINVAASAILVAAASAAGGLGMAPSAWAYNAAINGTYTATVIGSWAQTNYVYHQEEVVRSTWRVTSSCSTAEDCTGQVTSDQGWSAKMTMTDGGMWTVRRDIPNWVTCPDGTSFTGTDFTWFVAVDPDTGVTLLDQPEAPVLAGRNHTSGPSGICGTNAPLFIDQPFRLDKIG